MNRVDRGRGRKTRYYKSYMYYMYGMFFSSHPIIVGLVMDSEIEL